jgi:uncharacterized delta-60 repeat protein
VKLRWLIACLALAQTTTLYAVGLDPTFATNGRYVFERNGGSSIAGGAIFQRDGKLVVSGSFLAAGGSAYGALVFRFNPDGTLDNTFGQNGVVVLNIGLGSGAGGITQQPDGKLLVAGGAVMSAATRNDFMCVRLNLDGSLDTTFGGGTGYVTIDFSDNFILGEDPSESAREIALQTDGSIVLAGPESGFTIDSMQIARVLSDGQRDVSFSGDGRSGVFLASAGGFGRYSSMRLTPDGKALLLGYLNFGLNSNGFILRKWNTDGTPDPVFATTRYMSQVAEFREGHDLLVLEDGRILVAGQAGNDAFVARVLPDSQLDSSYGTGGFLRLSQPTAILFSRMLREPSGSLLVSGQLLRAGTTVNDGFVGKLTPNGGWDSHFSSLAFDTNDAGTSFDFQPVTMLRAADGKIVVVGTRGYGIASSQYDRSIQRITVVRMTNSPEFGFSVGTVDVRSSASSAIVSVRRIGNTTGPVTLDYATASGTAIAGTDFTSTSGTLTWAAGDSETKSITVPINASGGAPPTRQFTVIMSNPSEGYISSNSALVSIRSDLPPEGGGGGGGNGGGGGGWIDPWLAAALACGLVARLRKQRAQTQSA